jgi:pimeloyl-ACP methyl ester carboxylesterase
MPTFPRLPRALRSLGMRVLHVLITCSIALPNLAGAVGVATGAAPAAGAPGQGFPAGAHKPALAPGDTTRVSVSSSGAQGNDISYDPSISADGRYVAFSSRASSLVSGDTNGEHDIFVRDSVANTTTRVSLSSSGMQANSSSYYPSISADGRYVAFYSGANNLVSGDTNGFVDIFVRDTVANSTTRVSVSSSGMQANNSSNNPSISADGRYVAFGSYASNLASGDTNRQPDIFVRDTVANSTTRVSVSSSGAQGNSGSFDASISTDGRYVAFSSDASNLVSGDTNGFEDVFVRDSVANTTTLLSLSSSGAQGNNRSGQNAPSISGDGRYVAFSSSASNLVSGDTNNGGDIFVRDSVANTTTLVSLSSSGAQGSGGSPSISADGRYVAFVSSASNLVSGDTNGTQDIFVRDTIANTTTLVSVSSSGAQGNGTSYYHSISGDGRYVAFTSYASNLVSGDTNGFDDVFVHETGFNAMPTPTPTPTCYTLTTNVIPPDAGQVFLRTQGNCNNGAGYTSNTVVEVTVQPNINNAYAFAFWTSDNSWVMDPYALTTRVMIGHANSTITANLRIKPPLILVHGYEGFNSDPHPYPFDCNTGVMRYADQVNRGKPDNSAMGTLPHDFKDKYDVWMAYWTTGPLPFGTTPGLEDNANCLHDEIKQVYEDTYHQPITLVTHSMGGLVSRACLSRPQCGNKVRALYTMGTPHAGINAITIAALWIGPLFLLNPANLTLTQLICTVYAGVCQMETSAMLNFNVWHPNQSGIKYGFIGGNAPSAPGYWIAYLDGPNDGGIGQYSAVGWSYRSKTFAPFNWSSASMPTQIWTDEAHISEWANPNYYMDGHISFHCIEGLQGHESRPAGCKDADARAGLALSPHLALQTMPTTPQTLPSVVGHLNMGESLTQPIAIDTSSQVSFYLAWRAGTLDFSLTQPDGTLITPGYAEAHPDFVTYEISPATSMTPPMAVYTFPHAAPGMWSVHVTAGALDVDGTNFLTSAVMQTTRTFKVSANANLYHPGETATLTATLQDETGGLGGATIVGTFHRSDGITDTITFADQGNGIYMANYTVPPTTGFGFMSVRTNGQTDSIAFAREELLPLPIVSRDASLSGDYADTTQDPDGNGRYDTLNVQVGVDAVRAGNFTVSGDLVASDQLVAHSATDAALVAGHNIVTLTFGGDNIRRSQLSSPYTLTHVAILDGTQADLPTDTADNVWQTEAYNWQGFGVCYSLSTGVDPLPVGSVTANPAPDCSGGQYSAGTEVTLSAIPNSGFSFVGWGGDEVDLSSPFTVTMDRNLNLTAFFIDESLLPTSTPTPTKPSDTTPPVITTAITGTTGLNGWYTSDVTVAWSMQDPESGIASSSGCATTLTTGATLTCSATNGAGLTSTSTTTVLIDKTPPVITAALTGTMGMNGWYTSDVTVAWSVQDSESGIASSSGCDTTTLTADTTGTTLTCSATNGAGLTSTTTTTVKLDKTAPNIAIVSPQARAYTHTLTANIAWIASDATSGVASETGQLDGGAVTNGQAVDLFYLSLDPHTVVISASDQAGNSGSASQTFTVTADINSLIAATKRACDLGWINSSGTCNSLGQKLAAAQAALQRSQSNTAANQLAAFIQELNAQKDKKVNLQAYNLLIADAQYVKSTLP